MLIIHTTCGSRKEAQKIADECVRCGIAACASFFPIRSVYRWKGKMQAHKEYLLELKVKDSGYRKAEAKILSLHSYSLPQIVAVRPSRALARYGKWVGR